MAGFCHRGFGIIGITDTGDRGLIALAACQAYVLEVTVGRFIDSSAVEQQKSDGVNELPRTWVLGRDQILKSL